MLRLLFSVVGGEGHLQPLLPVARAAASAGHTVLVTGAQVLGPLVAASGLSFAASGPDAVAQRRPLQSVDRDREARAVRESFADRMARHRAADLLPLCRSWRPDVVVRDEMDFGAAVVAERLGLPHVSVLVIAAGGFVVPAVLEGVLDKLRSEHGLPPDPDLVALSRHLVLSPFPASFRDPADLTWSHGFRLLPAQAAMPMPPWFDHLGNDPVVYFTLGTIFNTESGDLFDRVLAGLTPLPVEVVVTVGRGMDPVELGPLPRHVHVEQYLPQAMLLPRCAAVVSHGGSGSVMGALEHGLPLVCLPMGADQPRNAERCMALGLGLALEVTRVTSDEVGQAVCTVLNDPGYRRSSAALQAEIHALPPAADAVRRLERLVS